MNQPPPTKVGAYRFPCGAVLTCGTDWFLATDRGMYGYHVHGGLGPCEVEFITLEGDSLEQT